MRQKPNEEKNEMIGVQKMSDDIIKNPLRSIPKPTTTYEPEYSRKGIKVVEAPQNLTVPNAVVSAYKKRDPNPPQEVFSSIDGINLDIDGNEITFERGHIIANNDLVDFRYGDIDNRAHDNDLLDEAFPNYDPIEPEEQNTPQVGEYILMVLGKLITSGNIDKIEKQVRDIMYGDSDVFKGKEISINDIVVLKRVEIKVGIFVSE